MNQNTRSGRLAERYSAYLVVGWDRSWTLRTLSMESHIVLYSIAGRLYRPWAASRSSVACLDAAPMREWPARPNGVAQLYLINIIYPDSWNIKAQGEGARGGEVPEYRMHRM